MIEVYDRKKNKITFVSEFTLQTWPERFIILEAL